MQRRVLAAAIALSCVIPSAVTAQLMPLQDDPSWGPRFRITPFVGYLPSVTRDETWTNATTGQNTTVGVDYTLAGGTALGLTGEMSVHGPWNVLAGVLFASRDESTFELRNTGEQFEINGSRYLMGKAGVSLTMRERESELTLRRLSASAHVAPFYMREMPRAEAGFENEAVFDGSNHFGINFGVAGEVPFAQDRMSLQIGIEDYATMWSEDALARLPASFYEGSTAGSTSVETGLSHMWLLRAGVSFRFR